MITTLHIPADTSLQTRQTWSASMLDKLWPFKSKNPEGIGLEFSLCWWAEYSKRRIIHRTQTSNKSAQCCKSEKEPHKKKSLSSSSLLCRRNSEKGVFSSASLHLNVTSFAQTLTSMNIHTCRHLFLYQISSAESFSLHALFSLSEDPSLTVACFWLVVFNSVCRMSKSVCVHVCVYKRQCVTVWLV